MTSNKQRHDVAARLRSEAENWREYCGDDTVYWGDDGKINHVVNTNNVAFVEVVPDE